MAEDLRSLLGRAETIEPYDPTFRQKARYFLQDVLGMSNRQSGNVMGSPNEPQFGVAGIGLADFVPGLGTGMQAEEAKQAFDQGRYLDAALNGAGVAASWIPGAGAMARVSGKKLGPEIARALRETSGSFGTIGARKFPKAKYRKASGMKAAGDSDQKIWEETGIAFEPDGSPIFEMPSNSATITPDGEAVLQGGGSRRLGEILDFPELYDNYPGAKNIRVLSQDMGDGAQGAYWGPEYGHDITIKPGMHPKGAREALIHETEHYLQNVGKREGGTNPSVATATAKRSAKEIAADPNFTAVKSNVEERVKASREARVLRAALDVVEGNQSIDELSVPMATRVANVLQDAPDVASLKAKLAQIGPDASDETLKEFDRLNTLSNTRQFQSMSPNTAYNDTFGEVQARNAGYRDQMSPEELKRLPPMSTSRSNERRWLTQNVDHRGVRRPPDIVQKLRAGISESRGPARAPFDEGAYAGTRLGIGANGGPSMDPTMKDILEARADQMDLPVKKRVQPRPDRERIIDTNYDDIEFDENLADNYPRNPDPEAKLPLNDRARFMIDRKDQIAERLAQKIRDKGLMGTDVQKFYSSSGPLYRAARNAGLSDEAAKKWLHDFSRAYASTSPRTETTQNLRNATLAMAKENEGIPFREIIGRGTVDAKTGERGISEKGYPMMTGKGGIHGKLLDTVAETGAIDPLTNPKPATFGGNMAGNLSGVTADTHAIRGAVMAANELEPGSIPEEFIIKKFRDQYAKDPTRLTPEMISDTLGSQKIGPKGAKVDAQTEYAPVADVYHKVAEILGVKPAEAQALGWFSLGDETNLGSELATVADLVDQRIDVTSQLTGADPQTIARLLFNRKIPLAAVGGAAASGALTQGQSRPDI